MRTPHSHLTFTNLRETNGARNQESFPECKDWQSTDWATALAGECGEACNFIKKQRRGDFVSKEAIAKELADLVIYADHLARHLDIDLGGAVQHKFNQISEERGSKFFL